MFNRIYRIKACKFAGLWLGLLGVATACDDNPELLRIVQNIDTQGTFFTVDVRPTGLESVDHLTGEDGDIFGKASIDLKNPVGQQDRGVSRDQVITNAHTVVTSWIPEQNVAVPLDFETLNMFTIYAHIERAAAHFRALVNTQGTSHVSIYYHPNLIGADEVGFTTADNAAYLRGIDAFIFLPMEVLQDIPLPINPGVVAHEYAHRIWYYEFWNAEMFQTLENVSGQFGAAQSLNLVLATDEGVADFFGAVIMNDPHFLSYSVPGELGSERNLDEVRPLPSAWLSGQEPSTTDGAYNPYGVGAVVASFLWRSAQAVGADQIERALLSAAASIGTQLRSNFDYLVGDIEIATIAALPANLRPGACSVAQTSYAVIAADFSSVCP